MNLGYAVTHEFPEVGKDFNEMLKAMATETVEPVRRSLRGR